MGDFGIGASVRRKEDFRFLTGTGTYTDDINRPGQLHALLITGGIPIETQVFGFWIMALAFERVSDAPLRKQKDIKMGNQTISRHSKC